VAGGVGEHRERVAPLGRAVVLRLERVQLLPHRTPLGLHGVEVVATPVDRGVVHLLAHGPTPYFVCLLSLNLPEGDPRNEKAPHTGGVAALTGARRRLDASTAN